MALRIMGRNTMEVRVRVLRLVGKPYEVQMSLLNAEGQYFVRASAAIKQR